MQQNLSWQSPGPGFPPQNFTLFTRVPCIARRTGLIIGSGISRSIVAIICYGPVLLFLTISAQSFQKA